MESSAATLPASCRLRRGRRSCAGAAYHLCFATHRRRPVFQNLIAARAVVRTLMDMARREHAETLAFVVMPDHVHWLCILGRVVELPTLVGNVKSRTTFRLRRRISLPRPLWQEGFFDRQMRRDEDLIAAARYIVSDPVRKGMVETLGQYPHWDAAWVGRSEG